MAALQERDHSSALTDLVKEKLFCTWRDDYTPPCSTLRTDYDPAQAHPTLQVHLPFSNLMSRPRNFNFSIISLLKPWHWLTCSQGGVAMLHGAYYFEVNCDERCAGNPLKT